MKSRALLSLLADGQVHSGESLATRLGISRTAIWKQIRRAMGEGVRIETIRGKGYRLLTDIDLLDEEVILDHLEPPLGSAIDLIVLDEVDSTNAEIVRRRPELGGGRIPVCVADCQTAGRGRRGRVWQSPRGQNLYLSLGLIFRGSFAMLDGLSLVLGVAVAEALEEQGVPDVGLKWPNDIFIGGSKLSGILVELQGELEEGIIQVVAGIGLNVHMKDGAGVDQSWSSLAGALPERRWCRNELAAAIIRSVLRAVNEFTGQGFGGFRTRWQSRDIFSGKPLTATHGELAGTGLGIDDSGNYLLSDGEEVVSIRAGEISLRVQS
ncbi:biotin--[acetyl-CoA-carboxylase] ligase [Marinobacter vulgaris]|uniref:Bifunctional ligase/repressor BirA n=1 Tax=Marinobacter vulgaris TaxID=1928331 RepID=A0A2V3ZGQ9_9GAMM|nr:biotin--[acetyl-CoA-carboxylase] ligase [Marinobacter vulgaris]PXX88363.1 biotin--[acetyl-CoA-carboxylase] ligase [Marinobacter vulgaris]TSJ68197.1 biotin--[acetyl-CoA-carboxylase] ligase [Marinobacter vulgaris]